MVDDHLIDTMDGVELLLHHPVPREIAIVHDAPWEGGASGYHTVFQDGPLYRMYYRGHRFIMTPGKFGPAQHEVICYAVSTDGVNWTTPDLGLVAFDGSTKNNIVWDGVASHNFTPFIDTNPDCAPDAKYKALGGLGNGLYVFKSSDAVRWSLISEKPVITKGAFDSQNVGFWDEARGRYAAYFRTFTEEGGKRYRTVAMTTSPDFVNWEPAVPLTYPGAPTEQLYTNQVIPYYRAPHILVGFPTRYVDRPLTDHVKTLDPVGLRDDVMKAILRGGTDLTDGLFMTSRDGVTFHRWAEAFIRPGLQEKGTWMYGDMYQSWGLVETRCNPAEEHLPNLARMDMPNELSMYLSEGAWRDDVNRMRRYSLRIDGFVSMHAKGAGGEFTTKPLTFTGAALVINYSSSAAGSVRVELQTADGAPIDGFSLADCPEMYGDTINQTVSWKAGPDVSALAGQTVRIRFVLKDADVYSLRFR
ncbi:MAG: hypothetical protein GY851_34275 [bacterium]|nr:hypothetical protein [bacterium]